MPCAAQHSTEQHNRVQACNDSGSMPCLLRRYLQGTNQHITSHLCTADEHDQTSHLGCTQCLLVRLQHCVVVVAALCCHPYNMHLVIWLAHSAVTVAFQGLKLDGYYHWHAAALQGIRLSTGHWHLAVATEGYTTCWRMHLLWQSLVKSAALHDGCCWFAKAQNEHSCMIRLVATGLQST